MIERANSDHIDGMATLHHKYIRSLLQELGFRMCRSFYKNALTSPLNFAYVYIEDNGVRGFIFGTEDNSLVFKDDIIKLSIILAVLRKPYLIKKLFFHLTDHFTPAPEKLYSVVDERWRGMGMGKELHCKLHEEFKNRNIKYYEVRVDKKNKPAIKIHQNFGGEIFEEFEENGRSRLKFGIKVV
jgi:ribosomal protein S18 acetylase RimI-like enzyme